MRRWYLLMLGLSLVLPLPVGAGARYIYTNHKLDYVKLTPIPKKELSAKAPTHPATISTAKMREILAGIKLSRKLILSKEIETQEVYNDRAVNFLAPKLVEAFAQASLEEEVVFSWVWKDPRLLVRDDRFTAAKAWVKGNELHLEFLKVHAKLMGDYERGGNFDKAVNRAKSLRIALEPQPGQMLGASNAHELVIDMTKTMTASTSEATSSMTSSAGAAPLKDRLRELEKLRKAKLLTDEEYQSKRRELLQQL
ncbi:MAG: hypothetical protein HYV03_05080 [Deltaproteobacteria bacterium]|nr:hypothetical protein [Deltaproteobacteria bacterium]